MERLLIGLALTVIPFYVAWVASRKMLAEERARSRTPFTEKLLRPAGESLRLKIDEIRDEMDSRVMAFAFLVVVPVILAAQSPLKTFSVKLIVYLTLPAICWIFAVSQWRKLRSLRKAFRSYGLGCDGERYVASELDLRADGFRVYHDFIFDMKPGGEATTFNIDHIVIGPPGIFAIETKTRRKRRTDPEGKQKNHEVVFDGTALTFSGNSPDTSAIRQAHSNATDLSDWLTGTRRVKVPVLPVVVIPGWWVERKGASNVRVLSGKEIAHTIRTFKAGTLAAEELSAFADRIEAHCRNIDVE